MRIIHILSSGISGINGVTNVVTSLSSCQEKLGHLVRIIDIKTERSLPIILNFNPDIVCFHGLYYFEFIAIAYRLQKNSIPYLIQFHGGASSDNYQKHKLKKFIANHLIFNRFIRNASSVVYLNQGEYSKSIFKNVSKSFFFMPNGVEQRRDYNKSIHSKVNILFFSRIDIYGKGLDVLADVIKEISNTDLANTIMFSFFGHIYESSKHYFNQFHDIGNVKYYGTVYGEEKDKAFEESDIVILPSRSEGMPLTVLEAFSYGRPVIITPETNMGEIVVSKNAGWVTRLTKDDLYRTIITAIRDYLNDIDGYRNRSHQCSYDYSWESIAKQSIIEYKSFVRHG